MIFSQGANDLMRIFARREDVDGVWGVMREMRRRQDFFIFF
jgi:pentatricopeptide repeat protein